MNINRSMVTIAMHHWWSLSTALRHWRSLSTALCHQWLLSTTLHHWWSPSTALCHQWLLLVALHSQCMLSVVVSRSLWPVVVVARSPLSLVVSHSWSSVVHHRHQSLLLLSLLLLSLLSLSLSLLLLLLLLLSSLVISCHCQSSSSIIVVCCCCLLLLLSVVLLLPIVCCHCHHASLVVIICNSTSSVVTVSRCALLVVIIHHCQSLHLPWPRALQVSSLLAWVIHISSAGRFGVQQEGLGQGRKMLIVKQRRHRKKQSGDWWEGQVRTWKESNQARGTTRDLPGNGKEAAKQGASSGDCRGWDKSGHKKKATERRILMRWGPQRE